MKTNNNNNINNLRPPLHVLLTGASGFLGSHLLSHLIISRDNFNSINAHGNITSIPRENRDLNNPRDFSGNLKITCLVRGGRKRIESQLKYYGLYHVIRHLDSMYVLSL